MVKVSWIAALALAVGLSFGPAPEVRAGAIANIPCPVSQTRLVVLGDSLADGLWGSLYRVFARCPEMEVIRLTQVSDGLTKSAPETWLARYEQATPSQANTPTTDIVIVQIGANDITFIREGATRASFGTPEWTTAYSTRATSLAAGLADRATAVIWFGLPIVGASRLEPSYREISALLEASLSNTKASYQDIHDATTYGTGQFAMSGVIDGRRQQMRATDQIHFTTAGYDHVLGTIFNDLGRLLTRQDRQVTLENVDLQ
ncbi:MAG: GDSL-type esterase/lipase family protein [Pseudomonadota bacterium]